MYKCDLLKKKRFLKVILLFQILIYINSMYSLKTYGNILTFSFGHIQLYTILKKQNPIVFHNF